MLLLKANSPVIAPELPLGNLCGPLALWSLRKKLRDSFKFNRETPSQSKSDYYIRLKANYQLSLRSAKKDSWKSFSTNNLNGDIFGELKKLTISAPSNAPTPPN